jgi:Asp-tRNA(Asn)/Glu-tRNA(Gln) amidotransferase A subunit family amidase
MDRDLIWSTATELRERIGRGDLSPVALVEASLARIDQLDGQLRAFVTVDCEGARAAARQAEEDVRRGVPLGPLHGLPVAVKDDLWAAGMPATTGSLIFARFVPSRDGTVVARLRAAGAIIIGKTNLPEFASWPRTKSWVGGETVNPWDLTRIPGASSGGSAAAVASGMVPLAIGTDGGGSVRIPSALCGLVGLFPSLGRVPDHGSFLCSPLSSAGPMARSVRDVALLQETLAGPDHSVPASQIGAPPPLLAGLEAGVEGLRVAWSPDFGWIPADPGIVAAGSAALEALGRAGARVEPLGAPVPHPWGAGELMADAFAGAAAWNEPDPVAFGEAPDTAFAEAALADSSANLAGYFSTPEVRGLLESHAHLLSPPHRVIARTMRPDAPVPSPDELHAAMDAIFASQDVLCSPTMAWPAPVAPEGWASPYPDAFSGTNFTFIANATGCPAATVPCGLVDGLPAGFQIIGRRGAEATVLRVARAVEAALPPLPRPSALPD